MKKIIYITAIFYSVAALSVFAQPMAPKINENTTLDVTSKEYVYIHQNTTVSLVGEYMYYKVYCLDADKSKLSIRSKFAFVTLVNEANKPIFTHKILLTDSQGQGDYFIPEGLPSGNYKLVGYTQLMRQQGQDTFFKSDVSIINPYQQQEESFIAKSTVTKEQVIPINHEISEENGQRQLRTQNLSITPDKAVYKTREAANVKVSTFGTNAMEGTYSVSVKRVDFTNAPRPISSKTYVPTFSNTPSRSGGASAKFLATVKGDYLSGKVITSNNDLPLNDVQIGMSILGREFNIKLAISDTNGAFYFDLDNDYDGQQAAFQIMDDFDKNYRVIFDAQPDVDFSFLDFGNFKIDPSAKNRIIDRSVHNQIENAYFKVRPDTVLVPPTIKPFYGLKRGVAYDLDDYTRFNTTTETLTEILEDAYTRKRKGKTFVGIRTIEDVFSEATPALVLIDDVMIQDHQLFLNLSSQSIQKITVVRDNYVFGGKEYRGILVVETIKGEFHKRYDQVQIADIKMVPTLENKQYFKQSYNTNDEKSKRIPDYRSQLLWEPNVSITKDGADLSFYTSDAVGMYEISLEGFKKDGSGVSLVQYILVE